MRQLCGGVEYHAKVDGMKRNGVINEGNKMTKNVREWPKAGGWEGWRMREEEEKERDGMNKKKRKEKDRLIYKRKRMKRPRSTSSLNPFSSFFPLYLFIQPILLPRRPFTFSKLMG